MTAWGVWCANLLHLWWGVLFLLRGSVPENFGGTQFFLHNGGNVTSWGVTLVLISVLAIAGMILTNKFLCVVLMIPQQFVLMAAASHAIVNQAFSGDQIKELAAAYVICIAIAHTMSICDNFIVRPGRKSWNG